VIFICRFQIWTVGISDESAAVQYAGINEAITEIKKLGQQVYLAKTDVRQAFRILPVAPQDYQLLRFYGRKRIPLIVVCQWVVEQAARYSNDLVLAYSGLPLIS
jgi:hypothetical protein